MCPITRELPADPVVASDGYTYERAAITEWIGISSDARSPMVPSCRISLDSLHPNLLARHIAEDIIASGTLGDEVGALFEERRAEAMFLSGDVEGAARKGFAKAQCALAERFYFGSDGYGVDMDRAFEWALKAAEKGYRLGQFRAGFILYERGDGAGAMGWYSKAARQGCVTSTHNLGLMKLDLGLVKEGLDLLKASSDMGLPDSMYALGIATVKFGSGADSEAYRAFRLIKNASEMGHMKATRKLALMLIRGFGCRQNVVRGYGILNVLANAGDDIAALYELASDDEGRAQAFRLIRDASARGNAKATRILARMLIRGVGCERDVVRGHEMLESLANSGAALAA